MAFPEQYTALALFCKRKNPLTMKQGDFNYLSLFLHHQLNLQRVITNVVTVAGEEDNAVLTLPASKRSVVRRKKIQVKAAA
jgi:hypothetical protein